MDVKFRVEVEPRENETYGLRLRCSEHETPSPYLQKWVEQFSCDSKVDANDVAHWFNCWVENEEDIPQQCIVPTINLEEYTKIFQDCLDYENLLVKCDKMCEVIKHLNGIEGLGIEMSEVSDELKQIKYSSIESKVIFSIQGNKTIEKVMTEARVVEIKNIPVLVFIDESWYAYIIKPVIIPLYKRVSEVLNIRNNIQ